MSLSTSKKTTKKWPPKSRTSRTKFKSTKSCSCKRTHYFNKKRWNWTNLSVSSSWWSRTWRHKRSYSKSRGIKTSKRRVKSGTVNCWRKRKRWGFWGSTLGKWRGGMSRSVTVLSWGISNWSWVLGTWSEKRRICWMSIGGLLMSMS